MPPSWRPELRRIVVLSAILAIGLSSCSTPGLRSAVPPARTLTVFAAASLTQALEQIGHDFEAQNPGLHIAFNFAGSQALRMQIEQGAPVDVFASASPADMDAVITAGNADASAVQPFVTNVLQVILPASNPAGIEKLEDLGRPGLKLVVAAPDVPVGRYARQALGQMDKQFGAGFSQRVLANVVSQEDNVKQVVAKVELGEADAGIVYISDAVAAPDLKTIEIPPELNVSATYVIAPMKAAHDAQLAEEFVAYTRSDAAQRIFAKWGFSPIP